VHATASLLVGKDGSSGPGQLAMGASLQRQSS
jgi:hypothetical protein